MRLPALLRHAECGVAGIRWCNFEPGGKCQGKTASCDASFEAESVTWVCNNRRQMLLNQMLLVELQVATCLVPAPLVSCPHRPPHLQWRLPAQRSR